MNKLRQTIPLLLCFLALGCNRGNDAEISNTEEPPPQTCFYINPDEVSHILFANDRGSENINLFDDDDSEDTVEERYEHGKFSRTANRDEILELVRAFNDLHKQPEGAVTFSGAFGHLWFMSSNNVALASTFIILNGSGCVMVSMDNNPVEEDGRLLWLMPYEYDPALNMDASCPQYAAIVLKAMKKYAPDKVEQAWEFVKWRNASLEDALGIQNQSSP